jgi:hypothetical protein
VASPTVSSRLVLAVEPRAVPGLLVRDISSSAVATVERLLTAPATTAVLVATPGSPGLAVDVAQPQPPAAQAVRRRATTAAPQARLGHPALVATEQTAYHPAVPVVMVTSAAAVVPKAKARIFRAAVALVVHPGPRRPPCRLDSLGPVTRAMAP